ncbi:MAG: response regulator transcription factor [Bacteroidetes bacterium]|nr:response regulator transcription factor [Bacteroidota bacterium]
MKKCFIINSQEPIASRTENSIEQISSIQYASFTSSPMEAIEMIRNSGASLIYLDKNVDETNGIELISHLNKQIKIIISTSFADLAITSFNLDMLDSTMKPIPYNHFIGSIEVAVSKLASLPIRSKEMDISCDYIFVKTESKGKMIKLDLDDINYIQGMSNYVAFHTKARVIISHFTLRQLEELLPKSRFIRVHKSFIVPIRKITAVARQELKLSTLDTSIPLSPNFRAAFMQRVSIN